MHERVCVIVQQQAEKYARERVRDRGGGIQQEKEEEKRKKKEGKGESVCGVLDIQTDSIHLSPPGVPVGRASLLGRP